MSRSLRVATSTAAVLGEISSLVLDSNFTNPGAHYNGSHTILYYFASKIIEDEHDSYIDLIERTNSWDVGLETAVCCGKLALANRVADLKKFNPDYRDGQNETLISRVLRTKDVQWDQVEELVTLIDSLAGFGVPVRWQCDQGYSALHWAVNINVAKVLLKHGALVNVKNEQGETPLVSICRNLYDENVGKIIMLFLDHIKDADDQDIFNDTLECLSMQRCKIPDDIFDAFVKAGANPQMVKNFKEKNEAKI